MPNHENVQPANDQPALFPSPTTYVDEVIDRLRGNPRGPREYPDSVATQRFLEEIGGSAGVSDGGTTSSNPNTLPAPSVPQPAAYKVAKAQLFHANVTVRAADNVRQQVALEAARAARRKPAV